MKQNCGLQHISGKESKTAELTLAITSEGMTSFSTTSFTPLGLSIPSAGSDAGNDRVLSLEAGVLQK